jgi:methylated-DNA-[protein]-cysteine S-methyltransferase
MIKTQIFETPAGWIGLAASRKGRRTGISRIVLGKSSRQTTEEALLARRATRDVRGKGDWLRQSRCLSPFDGILDDAERQLKDYFSGKRRRLDFPLCLTDGTAFQRRVWRTAMRIPFGRVRSYKWIAFRIGGPRQARAVGLALGANPVPVAIPCHRVVAHDGSLGGFSCGLRVKRKLLALEGTLRHLRRK